ncbi:hypothetical protein ASG43_17920 [Aureimonas sp. Leaf454]|nr:hypothetical protein ASG43_17920 [Aureimonas sp. Leaf454]
MLVAGLPAANAQDAARPASSSLTLELNTAKDVATGCRLALVAFNGTPTSLDEMSYEVVVFDGQQRVSQFVLFEFGALPPKKTKIVQFDIANAKCAEISRLVLNNASRCQSAGGSVPICLDRAVPTSRTAIAFGL